ncbi:MAG: Re/Si-specific NAD(P)(+) transhydrogenase subunit alpha [Gemmatimonadetes bacterium]|nr:Re/Si-specific NAD(P)(+) transhydrogenase subunit alpha [Gemmatimonadota bacterium]
MRIGVPRETTAGERRVGLVPESVTRLKKAGVDVRVQRGAGTSAYVTDEAYAAAGARLVDDASAVFGDCDVICKVQRPSPAESALVREGALLISLLQPSSSADTLAALNARRVTALALERVPRITRAQSMDILSSQATVAGYKAVLLAATHTSKLLPMLTTAAGNIPPAKAFVVGAGVAGLMAIATARRLGAVVSGYDVRAAAREQVLSLGATFIGPEPQADAEAAGGYAREQTEEEKAKTLAALAAHVTTQDLIITTAQIPGRPAPRIITAEMVHSMRPGTVLIDMAAETGGNCELTVAGEVVDVNGVTIVGAVNLPSSTPYHASVMFSKNVLTLLQHMIKDGALGLNLEDEIIGPMCVAHDGASRA